MTPPPRPPAAAAALGCPTADASMAHVPVLALPGVQARPGAAGGRHQVDRAAGALLAITGALGVGHVDPAAPDGYPGPPTSGTDRVDRVDRGGVSDRQLAWRRARQVGLGCQQVSLLERVSALDHGAMAPRSSGVRPPRRRLAAATLGGWGWATAAGTAPASCPAASNTASRSPARGAPAPVVLADEPTGNLDPAAGHQVLAPLEQLNHQRGHHRRHPHDRDIAARHPCQLQLRDGRVLADTHQADQPDAATPTSPSR